MPERSILQVVNELLPNILEVVQIEIIMISSFHEPPTVAEQRLRG